MHKKEEIIQKAKSVLVLSVNFHYSPNWNWHIAYTVYQITPFLP